MDHYQYNGQQTPPVNRNSYGNQIWYIWGPIVVKIVIGMIVSGVASAAIGAAYMIRHYGLSAQMTCRRCGGICNNSGVAYHVPQRQDQGETYRIYTE